MDSSAKNSHPHSKPVIEKQNLHKSHTIRGLFYISSDEMASEDFMSQYTKDNFRVWSPR